MPATVIEPPAATASRAAVDAAPDPAAAQRLLRRPAELGRTGQGRLLLPLAPGEAPSYVRPFRVEPAAA